MTYKYPSLSPSTNGSPSVRLSLTTILTQSNSGVHVSRIQFKLTRNPRVKLCLRPLHPPGPPHRLQHRPALPPRKARGHIPPPRHLCHLHLSCHRHPQERRRPPTPGSARPLPPRPRHASRRPRRRLRLHRRPQHPRLPGGLALLPLRSLLLLLRRPGLHSALPRRPAGRLPPRHARPRSLPPLPRAPRRRHPHRHLPLRRLPPRCLRRVHRLRARHGCRLLELPPVLAPPIQPALP